jgi:hypothetical protein
MGGEPALDWPRDWGRSQSWGAVLILELGGSGYRQFPLDLNSNFRMRQGNQLAHHCETFVDMREEK